MGMRTMLAGLAVALVTVAAGLASGDTLAEGPIQDASVIQRMIDVAKPGAEVVPPAGTYRGHLSITKPVTLDGRGQVTLDGGGEGSVVWLETNDAMVRNLHIRNSGALHNNEDAGIQVRGHHNIIKDNVIDGVLFGIVLEKSDHNIVKRNKIAAKPLDLGMRGDAIKLWYSNENTVEGNDVRNSRDVILWYSSHNHLTGNVETGGRYGLHLMYATYNLIENNRFYDNSIGISMMYSTGDIIRNNYIAKATGSTGTCIAMKESSTVTVANNDIVYCAIGLNIDVSPYQPDTQDLIDGNRISYNDIAIAFLNDWHDNVFTANSFKGNITEVAVFGGGSAKRNTWDGNRWEDYQGFDRNGDGIGDTPHRLFAYAGQVWMDVPATRFFKGTPLLEVLDFLDRLAPFSEPVLLLEDKHPLLESRS
jgi:nitrous oxidase accessory protein